MTFAPAAMGTQTRIAQAIRDGGGDQVLSLKENWPATFAEVTMLFDQPSPRLKFKRFAWPATPRWLTFGTLVRLGRIAANHVPRIGVPLTGPERAGQSSS